MIGHQAAFPSPAEKEKALPIPLDDDVFPHRREAVGLGKAVVGAEDDPFTVVLNEIGGQFGLGGRLHGSSPPAQSEASFL
jgi:hypothetical protein